MKHLLHNNLMTRLIGLALVTLLLGTAVFGPSFLQANEESFNFLPYIQAPPPTSTPTATITPSPTPTLTPTSSPTPIPLPQITNPSFEEGWTDLPPLPWNLVNQQPNGWQLSWVNIGAPLYNDPDTLAAGVPECVHKFSWQLPPNEQPGGPDALILDGDVVFKMFHSGSPFGSELRQTLTGLVPGSSWVLVVPIQVHLAATGDTDPFSAESGVWVNGVGGWATAAQMGDREWYEHHVPFTVPANGAAEIVIRVKSKYFLSKDFFIDALRIEEP